jgi:fibronectin type 3 domain-containing protein
LHISNFWSANNNSWGASPANLRLWRDQIHYNAIRLCMVDPWEVLSGQAPWGIDATFPYADAVINNADSLGIYVILDYHCPNAQLGFKGASGVEWSSDNFWRKYAPRYKDRPFVLYEMRNEGSGCPAPSPGVVNDGWVADYKIIRAAAPNTVVLHCSPACMDEDWGPWLKNTHAPSCGFKWEDGKDVFAFHTYDPCFTSAITGPQALGIPVINTEFSYPEAGWYSDASLGGCKYPAEWCERNGVSWMDWYSNNAADQSARIKWIVPDAVNKGWDWWTITAPSAPTNATAQVRDPRSVTLTWSEPASKGKGILRYFVYRNDKEVSFPYSPASTTFTDTGLQEATNYTYQITAVTLAGREGPKSSPVQIATPVDNMPPAISLVSGSGDGTKVHIIFAEPIDRITALTAANYTIDNGVVISSVVMGTDQKTMILTVSKMTKEINYILTMNNIKDRAVTPNPIANNTKATLQYTTGVTRIRYFPRPGFASRMRYGVFEASNGLKDAGPYTVLYTIPVVPPQNWSEITEAAWTAQTGDSNFDRGYRYIRYRGPNGSACNVAEIEFYSGAAKAAGAPFGSPGSYQNSGRDYTKVFDGDTSTYMDFSSDNGGYAGLQMEGAASAFPQDNRLREDRCGIRISARGGQTEIRISGPRMPEQSMISVYSIRGELICAAFGQSTVVLGARGSKASALRPGQYVVEVSAAGFREARTVIIQK